MNVQRPIEATALERQVTETGAVRGSVLSRYTPAAGEAGAARPCCVAARPVGKHARSVEHEGLTRFSDVHHARQCKASHGLVNTIDPRRGLWRDSGWVPRRP